MKSLTAAIVATTATISLGLSALPAHASGQNRDNVLPATYIIYKLAQDGIQLRKLEAEGTGYEAWIASTDGTLSKVAIDPQTAELTATTKQSRDQRQPAPSVDAVQAIQTVTEAGHWDIREIELKKDIWRVKAGDDEGNMDKFHVDAQTGQLR